MSHELEEGVELQSVQGPIDNENNCLYMMLGSAPWQCKGITVVEQCGQMGMAPWARCEQNNGQVIFANLALMESVVIKAKDR